MRKRHVKEFDKLFGISVIRFPSRWSSVKDFGNFFGISLISFPSRERIFNEFGKFVGILEIPWLVTDIECTPCNFETSGNM